MTTLITRLYADEAMAQDAADALIAERFGAGDMELITNDGATDLSSKLKDAGLRSTARAAYASAMGEGNVLLILRAPFGTSVKAARTIDHIASIDVGLADETTHVPSSGPSLSSTIFRSHPLILSNPNKNSMHAHVMGKDPILRGRTKSSAIKGGAYMSKKFWPMKLLLEAKTKSSVIKGGYHVSSMISLPTISRV